MSRRYLVGIADLTFQKRAFGIVSAPDRYEASMRFLEGFAPRREHFVKYVQGTTLNASLAEHFWFKTKEGYRMYLTGKIDLDEKGFRRRVRRFFSDSRHADEYTGLYLEWYFTQRRMEQPAAVRYTPEELVERFAERFPSRMWAYTWFHSRFSGVVTVPIEHLLTGTDRDEPA